MTNKTKNQKIISLADILDEKNLKLTKEDGFSSTDELQTANPHARFYMIVDFEQGRREILPGAGAVKICIGYSIEKRISQTGQTVNEKIPQYVTKYF